MFCPLAVDWGNAADWVAGIGSLTAVFAAVGIAAWQVRESRSQRTEQRNEEHVRKAQLVTEIIRITAAIEAVAANGARLAVLGGGDSGLLDQKDEIEGLRLQLKSLQDFPQSDPRIYGEIGRIILESEFPRQFGTSGSSYRGLVLRDLAQKLQARREALTAVLCS